MVVSPDPGPGTWWVDGAPGVWLPLVGSYQAAS